MLSAQQTIKGSIAGTVVAIGLCFSAAVQAQDAAVDVTALKKAHPGWVQVPGQIIRPDCVHELPKGARVEVVNDKITGDVTMGGRVIAHYDACSEPGISTRPSHNQTRPKAALTPGTGNGWVEAVENDVSLGGSDNLDWLSGTWIVPPAPAVSGGLIYLFNGMEPSSQNWIIQPVLQYGNNGYFGGNYWVISSWMVGPNNYAFYSPAEEYIPAIPFTALLTSRASLRAHCTGRFMRKTIRPALTHGSRYGPPDFTGLGVTQRCWKLTTSAPAASSPTSTLLLSPIMRLTMVTRAMRPL